MRARSAENPSRPPLANVLITPHVAGNSPHIAGRHLALLLENIQRFRQLEKLVNVVNKQMWF